MGIRLDAIDADWIKRVKRKVVNEQHPLVKHYGPGDHPSGSSQDVHGVKGTGAGAPIDPTPPATLGVKPAPSEAPAEVDMTPLHEFRQFMVDNRDAMHNVAPQPFASWYDGTTGGTEPPGGLGPDAALAARLAETAGYNNDGESVSKLIRNGLPYRTDSGSWQSYDPGYYMWVTDNAGENIGYCQGCGHLVREVSQNQEWRKDTQESIDMWENEARRLMTDVDDGIVTGRREQRIDAYQHNILQARKALDKPVYWQHFTPRANPQYGAVDDAKAKWGLDIGVGPAAYLENHELLITSEMVDIPSKKELKALHDLHNQYDVYASEYRQRHEQAKARLEPMAHKAMLAVKERGRQLAARIDSAAVEPAAGTFKPGDKVYHVHGHVESGELTVVGPDPKDPSRIAVRKEYPSGSTNFSNYTLKPTDLVPVDSEIGALITDMEKRRVKLADEYEKAAARRNTLYSWGPDEKTTVLGRWKAANRDIKNDHLLVPNELVGKKRTRRGEATFRELNKSWTDVAAGSSDDLIDLTFTDTPPEIEEQSRYSDRTYKVIDRDKYDDWVAGWKAKGYTPMNRQEVANSMAGEYNGRWGTGRIARLAEEKIKKIEEERKGLAFVTSKADYAQHVIDAVSEHRLVGGEFDFVSKGSKGALQVADVQHMLPTDWIEASNELSPLSATYKNARAHYSPTQQRIQGSDRKAMLHELGHRFEHSIEEIRLLERVYYDSRTNNASDSLIPLTQLFPGHGYKYSEKARPDEFTNAYMGKTYNGRGSVHEAYELLSMGLEHVMFADSVTKRGGDLPKTHKGEPVSGYKDAPGAMSEDFRAFILGMLAEAGRP